MAKIQKIDEALELAVQAKQVERQRCLALVEKIREEEEGAQFKDLLLRLIKEIESADTSPAPKTPAPKASTAQ